MDGKMIKLFHDEYRSPLSAAVTARAVWELVARPCGGIWHLAGAERLSRLQIGQLLAARHPELGARIVSCFPEDLQGQRRARRSTAAELRQNPAALSPSACPA